jgi:hypothetical protein
MNVDWALTEKKQGGPNLNALVATLVLFSTVVVSVGLGVWAASCVVNTILNALGHRQQDNAPVLVPSQTHASGD